MAITVRIVDNSQKWLQGSQRAVAAGVEAAAEVLAAKMKEVLSKRSGGGGIGSGAGGSRPSSPGSPPAYQRGALHRSIRSTRATISGAVVSASAGTDRAYGRSLDQGFTATARGGGLLVPLQPEAYRLAERGAVRGNNDIFTIRRPGKPTILVRKGPNGSVVPLFVLPKTVRVAARPWLRPSLNQARAAMGAAFIRAAKTANRAAT